MTELGHYFRWHGNEVLDREGELIGTLERLFFDRESDEPKWALVNAGILGGSPMLVPLRDATVEGDALRVAFDRTLVWDVPDLTSGRKPTPEQERELYGYYRLGPGDGAEPGAPAEQGLDVVDEWDEGDVTVIRSEEELEVAVRSRRRERIRVVKRVVTENVTRTVPVRREKLRLIREPIGDEEPASDQPLPEEDVLWEDSEPFVVTLAEEELVIEKRVVPRERVRVFKETVTEEHEVSEDVRREEVDVLEEPARGGQDPRQDAGGQDPRERPGEEQPEEG